MTVLVEITVDVVTLVVGADVEVDVVIVLLLVVQLGTLNVGNEQYLLLLTIFFRIITLKAHALLEFSRKFLSSLIEIKSSS